MTDIKDLIKQVNEHRTKVACEHCDGTGKFFFDESKSCPSCSGEGKRLTSWPRVVTGIKDTPGPIQVMPGLGQRHMGKLVSVRLAGSANEEMSTYLGIYLGDLPTGIAMRIDADGQMTIENSGGNPAIWVPSLKKIVYGYESWWGPIETPEDLKAITDADIAAIPYVQALAAMEGKRAKVENASVSLEDGPDERTKN